MNVDRYESLEKKYGCRTECCNTSGTIPCKSLLQIYHQIYFENENWKFLKGVKNQHGEYESLKTVWRELKKKQGDGTKPHKS